MKKSSQEHEHEQVHVVSVRFKNNDGYAQSITHYYHFLFSSLFPLIEVKELHNMTSITLYYTL